MVEEEFFGELEARRTSLLGGLQLEQETDSDVRTVLHTIKHRGTSFAPRANFVFRSSRPALVFRSSHTLTSALDFALISSSSVKFFKASMCFLLLVKLPSVSCRSNLSFPSLSHAFFGPSPIFSSFIFCQLRRAKRVAKKDLFMTLETAAGSTAAICIP